MGFLQDDQGADQIDERAAREGVPLGSGIEPGFFSGTTTASVRGLARGLIAKPALLLGDALTPPLRAPAQALDQRLGTNLDNWLTSQQTLNREALRALKTDPLTTGMAGQIVSGLFDLGSSAVMFTPEGAAVLEGYARRQELIDEGIDTETATAAGAVTTVSTAVGIRLPLTIGMQSVGRPAAEVAKNVGFGAVSSSATGVAERGFSSDLLRRNGYEEQASLLRPYDEQAILAEATLGGLLSGAATAIQARSTVRGQETIDAALAMRTARHRTLDTAPGIPATPRATAAHESALSRALEQTLANERVHVGDTLADAEFVGPPRQVDQEEQLRAHVADLLPVPTFSPAKNAPRGIRNNNPGNIEAGQDNWEGQAGSDGRFVRFESPEAGIRALARTLITYQERHGLASVAQIIQRWAPPRENNTQAYIDAVAKELGVEASARLEMRDPDTLQRLAAAIIRHENGSQPYPGDLVRAGVDLALGRRQPQMPDRMAERVQSLPPVEREAPIQYTSSPTTRTTLADGAPARSEADTRETVDIDDASPAMEPIVIDTKPLSFDFPKVSQLEPVAAGSGVIQPKEIAPGRPLYATAPVEEVVRLLVDEQAPLARRLIASEEAPTQSATKGLTVELREGSASGQGRKGAAGQYETDLIAPRAIRAITLPAKLAKRGVPEPLQRALASFAREPMPDGSVRFVRKESRQDAEKAQTIEPARQEQQSGIPSPEPSKPDNARTSPPAIPATADGTPLRTAVEIARLNPNMKVALEDGTEATATQVIERIETERQQALQDAEAFAAAVHCFLRTAA